MGGHKYSDDENEELKILSENIVHYRTKCKKTQEEVAFEIGYDQGNYNKIETGKKNIGYLLQKKLAKALDITIEKLVKPRKKKRSSRKLAKRKR